MNFDKVNTEFLDLHVDYLYHLGIDTTFDLPVLFKEVKFAIFTRSHEDASIIAHILTKEFYQIHEDNYTLTPIYKTERFHFYKVGSAIIISAGVGMPSTLICLNEITKLFIHAKLYNPIFFHIGPSGGLGCPIGSLVINDKALNSNLIACYTSIECGEEFHYNTEFDGSLNTSLYEYAINHTSYNTLIGSSIGAYDYYDEQARFDGFLETSYTHDARKLYLMNAKDLGVEAINMESLAFAGFCNQLNIRAVAISTVINNRFISDQVLISPQEQHQILENASRLCAKYIMRFHNDA